VAKAVAMHTEKASLISPSADSSSPGIGIQNVRQAAVARALGMRIAKVISPSFT
jgi:hypothetical protein